MPHPSRTHLYVPADQPRLMRSAVRSPADVLIFDLEDGVAPGGKDTALAAVISTAARLPRDRPRWVRINPSAAHREIPAILSAIRVDGFWIPKAELVADIKAIADLVTQMGVSVSLGLLIESARGLTELRELSRLGGVDALQLGEIDLRADLGMPAGFEEDLHWARALLRTHGVAAGCELTVGPVYPNVNDLAGFRTSCQHLKRLGYRGRACIHPGQVEIANEEFTVGAEDIHAAHRLLDTYEASVNAGHGVFRDPSGSMVDAATVRRARTLTDRRPPWQ